VRQYSDVRRIQHVIVCVTPVRCMHRMVCGHWCIASKVSAVNGVGVFV